MSFLGQAAVIVEDDIDIFLDKFAEQSEGWEDAELQKEQFRSLFTAWCLINNVEQIRGNAMKSCVNYTKRQGLKN